MPPNFFSKLVKGSPAPHNRERYSSEYTPGDPNQSPSPTTERRSASSAANSSPFSSTTLSSSLNSNMNDTLSSSTYTHDTTDSDRTNLNVTVVPPSPHSSANSFSNGSMPHLTQSKQVPDQSQRTATKPQLPRPSTAESRHSLEDDLPTPTLNRPRTPAKHSKAATTHLPVTDTKPKDLSHPPSSGNLRDFSPGRPAPLDLPELRSQKSNRSMTKELPPLNTTHPRSATDSAQLASNAEVENGVYTAAAPIVESPKDIHPPGLFGASLERANTTGASSRQSTLVNPDSAKKGKWGRSGTRKPTGLASAIAASGLAMANPAFSAPQHAQLSPPLLSAAKSAPNHSKATLNGSPPFLSLDPSTQSTKHSRSTSADMSPRSGKSTKSRQSNHSNVRRPSLSAQSDRNPEPEERAEYSGLGEDSSDEDDSDSESDLGDLDDEEDIPVTGFAVASSKRNADFHELFPTIPEGDYLIEDYGCALQREILIQGRLYISENHICFHANIFGWITDLSIPIYEITALEKKMTAFVIPNGIQITTRQAKYTFASFLARDTTYDVIYNIWKLARPEDTASIMSSVKSVDGDRHAIAAGVLGAPTVGEGGAPGLKAVALAKKVTQCACSKDGQHFSELALDTVVPGTPDRIHNLMFASGFIKDFMRVDQKLLDIQIADWTPITPGSKLLARNMSFIKPLNSSVGPKQTKCEIRDETTYCDFDDYICMLTTTKTPDVPSGSVFSVKTRVCITWASAVSTRIVVTTQVDWTGRSFIKGIIERAAIEGQKVYHQELYNAMRQYIQAHQSEFMPAGVDIAAADVTPASPTSPTSGTKGEEGLSQEEVRKKREHERNQRGLQWAYDTFEGAYNVAKRSTSTALELVKDAWEQSTVTAILWFVIVILVATNIWTLLRPGRRNDRDPRRFEEQERLERDRLVQGVVLALWDELAAGKGPTGFVRHSSPSVSHTSPEQQPLRAPQKDNDWRTEVADLEDILSKAEERVQRLREGINEVKRIKLDDAGSEKSTKPLNGLD